MSDRPVALVTGTSAGIGLSRAAILAAVQADAPHLRYATSALMTTLVAARHADPTGDAGVALSGSRLPDVLPRSAEIS